MIELRSDEEMPVRHGLFEVLGSQLSKRKNLIGLLNHHYVWQSSLDKPPPVFLPMDCPIPMGQPTDQEPTAVTGGLRHMTHDRATPIPRLESRGQRRFGGQRP